MSPVNDEEPKQATNFAASVPQDEALNISVSKRSSKFTDLSDTSDGILDPHFAAPDLVLAATRAAAGTKRTHSECYCRSARENVSAVCLSTRIHRLPAILNQQPVVWLVRTPTVVGPHVIVMRIFASAFTLRAPRYGEQWRIT